jgi:hypothetical protein
MQKIVVFYLLNEVVTGLSRTPDENIIGAPKIRHEFNSNCFCTPITFNNALKVCFLNKKYPITIQRFPTQIVKVYF